MDFANFLVAIFCTKVSHWHVWLRNLHHLRPRSAREVGSEFLVLSLGCEAYIWNPSNIRCSSEWCKHCHHAYEARWSGSFILNIFFSRKNGSSVSFIKHSVILCHYWDWSRALKLIFLCWSGLLAHVKLFMSSLTEMNDYGQLALFGERGNWHLHCPDNQASGKMRNFRYNDEITYKLTVRWHNLNKNKDEIIFHVSAICLLFHWFFLFLFLAFPLHCESLYFQRLGNLLVH